MNESGPEAAEMVTNWLQDVDDGAGSWMASHVFVGTVS